jgi:hypothetical protein
MGTLLYSSFGHFVMLENVNVLSSRLLPKISLQSQRLTGLCFGLNPRGICLSPALA